MPHDTQVDFTANVSDQYGVLVLLETCPYIYIVITFIRLYSIFITFVQLQSDYR